MNNKQLNLNLPGPILEYMAFALAFPDGIIADSSAAELWSASQAPDSSRSARTHLPVSREEVLGIQELFRKSLDVLDQLSDWLFDPKSRIYLESQADEENLKTVLLKKYRYIHFATHGFANKNCVTFLKQLTAIYKK